MSAADAREELEAALWRLQFEAVTCHSTGLCSCCTARVDDALAAAEAYGQARAQEAVQASVQDGVRAELERLRQVRRDAHVAAQRGDLQPCGTHAAATRHRRRGDVPPGKKLRDVCPPCAEAEAVAAREYWRASHPVRRTGRTS